MKFFKDSLSYGPMDLDQAKRKVLYAKIFASITCGVTVLVTAFMNALSLVDLVIMLPFLIGMYVKDQKWGYTGFTIYLGLSKLVMSFTITGFEMLIGVVFWVYVMEGMRARVWYWTPKEEVLMEASEPIEA